MDIAIIRERQDENLTLTQTLTQNVVERFQQRFDLTDENKTETLILPVVPEKLEFPHNSDITNLKGVETEYNIPKRKVLHTMTIESVFPVNKTYSWIRTGSNNNGYDYADFFNDRQDKKLPFRLLAYEFNNGFNIVAGEITTTANNGGFDLEQNGRALFKVHCDCYFLVKSFKYTVDKTGDLKYTLEIEQFNEEKESDLRINWTQAAANALINSTVRGSLKLAGLI